LSRGRANVRDEEQPSEHYERRTATLAHDHDLQTGKWNLAKIGVRAGCVKTASRLK